MTPSNLQPDSQPFDKVVRSISGANTLERGTPGGQLAFSGLFGPQELMKTRGNQYHPGLPCTTSPRLRLPK